MRLPMRERRLLVALGSRRCGGQGLPVIAAVQHRRRAEADHARATREGSPARAPAARRPCGNACVRSFGRAAALVAGSAATPGGQGLGAAGLLPGGPACSLSIALKSHPIRSSLEGWAMPCRQRQRPQEQSGEPCASQEAWSSAQTAIRCGDDGPRSGRPLQHGRRDRTGPRPVPRMVSSPLLAPPGSPR